MAVHIHIHDYGPFTERLHPRNPGGMFVPGGQTRGKSGGGGRGKTSLAELRKLYAHLTDPDKKEKLRKMMRQKGATI